MLRTPFRSIPALAVLVVPIVLIGGVAGMAVNIMGQGPQGPQGRQGGQGAGQPSTRDGDWPSYNADVRGSRYSPLGEINAENFNKLEVAWRFKTDNLGSRPEFKLEGTPLVVKGIMYATGGTRRSVFALKADTGELLWVHAELEGERGQYAPRQLSGRGVAYWTDGRGDDRVVYVTTGYRLIELNAKTGTPVPGFGQDGVVDLKVGMVTGVNTPIDLVKGEAGLHATPTVSGNTILVGSSFKEGMTIATHNNTKGNVRAFDAKTGKLLWTFNTIPRPGEVGNETWENDSWKENGNTGVWTQMSVDEAAGLAYLPVEDPASDFYGGHRPGDNLYGDSLVCVDLKTGQRKWHYQIVHHPIWDYDLSSAPLLADVTIDGTPRKIVALPTKETFLYVFDRITGKPIWPIEERPVPQSDVPGEKTAKTQPFPTKPPAYSRQAVTENDLIDFTPELKAQALEQFKMYKNGPMFNPGIVSKAGGPLAAMTIGTAAGGTNWPGGSFDPETNVAYLFACNSCLTTIGLIEPPPGFQTDVRYIAGQAGAPFRVLEAAGAGTYADAPQAGRGAREDRAPAPPPPARGQPPGNAAPATPQAAGGGGRGGTTVQGLSILKPPYSTISAISLSKGEIVWQVPHGDTPDAVRNHPALKGIALPKTGQTTYNVGTLVTKTLVIAGDGQVTTTPEHPRGAMLRAYDKATGRQVGAVLMPAGQSGSPMTYSVNGRQYIIVAVSGGSYSGEYIAFSVPSEARITSQGAVR
jgi:quinoprotein glucose dehydrogenase